MNDEQKKEWIQLGLLSDVSVSIADVKFDRPARGAQKATSDASRKGAFSIYQKMLEIDRMKDPTT